MLNSKKIKFYLDKKFDIVINCSGYPRIKECEENILKSFQINFIAVKNLIDQILKYNKKSRKKLRLIHISSDAVYSSTSGNYKENDEYNPKTIYGICKVLSEIQVKKLKNYLIIRTRFFDKNLFAFKDAAINIYSSMLEINELAKIIYCLSFNKVTGILNVGGRKGSDYSILKQYYKNLKKTKREKIKKNLGYFITKDASLNLSKFQQLIRKMQHD